MFQQTDRWPLRTSILVLFFLFLLSPSSAAGDDGASEFGWSTSGRVSFIGARGNSDSTTAGLELALTRTWQAAELKIAGGALVAESNTKDRRAIGSVDAFEILELEEDNKAAEEFSASVDFTRQHSGKFLWLTGVSWEKNEAAGFFHRYQARFGLGYAARDEGEQCMKLALSLTWTDEDPLVEDGQTDDSFPGLRFNHTYGRPLTQTSRYESHWTLDSNFDALDDFRFDWSQTLTVSINKWLALELEARWRYDHQPALEAVPLLDLEDGPSGQTVNVGLEENDTQLTLALVFHR